MKDEWTILMAPIYKSQCGAWTINQVNPHRALYVYIQFSYPPTQNTENFDYKNILLGMS